MSTASSRAQVRCAHALCLFPVGLGSTHLSSWHSQREDTALLRGNTGVGFLHSDHRYMCIATAAEIVLVVIIVFDLLGLKVSVLLQYYHISLSYTVFIHTILHNMIIDHCRCCLIVFLL